MEKNKEARESVARLFGCVPAADRQVSTVKFRRYDPLPCAAPIPLEMPEGMEAARVIPDPVYTCKYKGGPVPMPEDVRKARYTKEWISEVMDRLAFYIQRDLAIDDHEGGIIVAALHMMQTGLLEALEAEGHCDCKDCVDIRTRAREAMLGYRRRVRLDKLPDWTKDA